MTRTTAGTIPAHHFDQARRKAAKTTFRHTLLTRSLIRTFKDSFGSIQSAEMSVLTILPADFEKKFFVHFSTLFTAIFYCVSKQAQFLTRTCATACSLYFHSITSKNLIL